MTEIVTSFLEQSCVGLLGWTGVMDSPGMYKKAGCFGEGRVRFSFISIDTTSDMVGLWAAIS